MPRAVASDVGTDLHSTPRAASIALTTAEPCE